MSAQNSLELDDRGFTATLSCGLRARFVRQAYLDIGMMMEEDEYGEAYLPLPGTGRAAVRRAGPRFP